MDEKISIITVCRNAVDKIEATLKSVSSQTYKNIEYLVVDGKSTDGTGRILDKYKATIDKLISESDQGIYDAMNKGVKKASGNWVFFLNSGDTFYNKDIVRNISSKLNKLKNTDIYYGNVQTDKYGIIKFDKVNRLFLIKNTICHQAMYIKKDLFTKYGLFNLKYKFASDYEWLLRMIIRHKIKIKYSDINISHYSLDGVSNNPNLRQKVLSEYVQIRKQYFYFPEIVFYQLYTIIEKILVSLK